MDKATALVAALAALFGVLATIGTNLLTRGRWEGQVTQLLKQHSEEIGELKDSDKILTAEVNAIKNNCNARHGNGHARAHGGFHD